MKLIDILTNDTIRIPLQNTEKFKIIEEMVDLLCQAHKIENREAVLKAVLEREKILSTGVGDGVAIPHCKVEGVKEMLVSFGVTKEDVDFASSDSKPVRLVFLIVGPQEVTSPHVRMLSRISRLMHDTDFREKLKNAKLSTEVLEALSKVEAKFLDI